MPYTWDYYKIVLLQNKISAEKLINSVEANNFRNYQHQLFLNQVTICIDNINTVVTGMSHPDAATANPEWYELVNINEAKCVKKASKFFNRRWSWMLRNVYDKEFDVTDLGTTYEIKFSQLAAQSKYNSGQLQDKPVNLATLLELMADNGIDRVDANKAIGVVCMFLPRNTGFVNNRDPLLVAINNRSLAGNIILNVAPYHVLIAPPTVEEFSLRMNKEAVEIAGKKYDTVYDYNLGEKTNCHMGKDNYSPPYSTIFLSNTVEGIAKESIVATLTRTMRIE